MALGHRWDPDRSGGSYLAGVLVGQVERVAGELDTTSCVALDQVGVVVAYYDTMLGAALEWCPCLSISLRQTGSVTRTGDLPDEIGGNVRKRHLDGDVLGIGEVVEEMGVKRRLTELVVVDTALFVLAIFC